MGASYSFPATLNTFLVSELNSSGCILHGDDDLGRLLGMPSGCLKGICLSELKNHSLPAAIAVELQQAIRYRHRWDGVLKFTPRQPGALTVWLHSTLFPVQFARGDGTAFLLLQKNITGSDFSLPDDDENLSLIARHTRSAVLVTGPEERIEWANTAFTHSTGYTLAEVLGKKPSMLQGPETSEETRQYMREMLDKCLPFSCEILNYHKDGRKYWVKIHCQPVFKNGKLARFFSIQNDITRTKQAELALRESEYRLKQIADSASVFIWMSDPEQRFYYFNRRWLQFTGSTSEQAAGNGWLHFIHPEDREQFRQVYKESFRLRKRFTVEYRLQSKTGKYHWLLDNATPLFSSGGQFRGYIGSCLDIHNRKKTEENLLHSRNHYQTLANNAPDMIMRVNRHLRFVYVNPVAATFLNCSVQEITGKTPPELPVFGQEVADLLVFSIKQVLETGERQNIQFNLENTSGNVHYLESRFVPEYVKGGRVASVLCIVRDITGHKLYEKALISSETKLNALFNSTTDYNFLLDHNRKIIALNKAGAAATLRLTGREAQIGDDFSVWAHKLNIKTFEGNFIRVLDGESIKMEKQIGDASKSIWISSAYYPARDRMGEVIGVVYNLTDITKRKTAELALKVQNEQLKQIARMQSHDVRRPLATIMGLVQLIDSSTLAPENRSFFELLQETAGELDTIIHQIVRKANQIEEEHDPGQENSSL